MDKGRPAVAHTKARWLLANGLRAILRSRRPDATFTHALSMMGPISMKAWAKGQPAGSEIPVPARLPRYVEGDFRTGANLRRDDVQNLSHN
jgi:hypothetical protein